MNELIKLNQNELTMSSREIAELTGKRHDNVMADCRKILNELNIDAPVFLGTYKTAQGNEYPCFNLPRRECDLLMMGYSVQMRAIVYDRWQELETKTVLPDFNDPVAAARAWADATEKHLIEVKQRQALEQQAKIDAPKVEFANAVMGSNDTKDMKQVAKIIALSGWGRNKIFDLLREHRILDRHNQPYQRYVDNGWFRQVESKYQKPGGEICISVKTVVFQKGIDGIRKLIQKQTEVSA